jgi:chromosome segregation ATPase
LRQSISGLDHKLTRLDTDLKKSSDSLERRVQHALQSSSEAKQAASEVKHYVDVTFSSVQKHVSEVGTTLHTHGEAIGRLEEKLNSSAGLLTTALATLDELKNNEIARKTREELMNEMAKESRNWVRWAVPLGFTLFSAFATLIVWFVSHHK